LKDEKPIEVQYFDAVSIEEGCAVRAFDVQSEEDVGAKLRRKIKKRNGEKPGGPNPVPSAREVPRR
jgi:hypothetical protein